MPQRAAYATTCGLCYNVWPMLQHILKSIIDGSYATTCGLCYNVWPMLQRVAYATTHTKIDKSTLPMPQRAAYATTCGLCYNTY